MLNFVSVIRNGKTNELNAPVEAGAHVATVAQMGNIAFRSGQKLEWNSKAGKFTDEKINSEYFAKSYYNGYKLPVIRSKA